MSRIHFLSVFRPLFVMVKSFLGRERVISGFVRCHTGQNWGPCARRSVGSTASSRRKGADLLSEKFGGFGVMIMGWQKQLGIAGCCKLSIDTFDGFWINPASTSWKKVFAGFHRCQVVVWDFWNHQQYVGDRVTRDDVFVLPKMLLIYFGCSVGVGLCKYFQVPYTLWKINGWNMSS